MASLNKVFLIGNLGADPELRQTQSGTSVCNFRLATTEPGGERGEATEWHAIVAWGKTAELCERYLSRGRCVHVEGRIKSRTWEDREGNRRHVTEIHAERVTFLPDGRGGGGGGGGDAPPPSDDERRDTGEGGDGLPF